jgi:chemotaxis protein methyltransferase CheR
MELSDAQFQSFSRMIYDISGIDLHEGKKSLVVARLAKRIRQGGFKSFKHYYEHVMNDKTGEEVVNLLDCISTNLTYFFRESKHFDFLAARALEEIVERKARGKDRELRFWCAGCSSGEEPYSLAITILERLGEELRWPVKIFATDISTRALKTAAAGVYKAERVADIPGPVIRRYFQRGHNSWKGHYRLKGRVREMVEFFRLNLMEPFPFEHYLDVIFCRNVMIYFDRHTQAQLVGRFYDHMAGGGYLFVGHSESLTGIRHGFKYVMPSVYLK